MMDFETKTVRLSPRTSPYLHNQIEVLLPDEGEGTSLDPFKTRISDWLAGIGRSNNYHDFKTADYLLEKLAYKLNGERATELLILASIEDLTFEVAAMQSAILAEPIIFSKEKEYTWGKYKRHTESRISLSYVHFNGRVEPLSSDLLFELRKHYQEILGTYLRAFQSIFVDNAKKVLDGTMIT